MRCQAKSKRSGEQCGRHATPGRRTCRFHGGSRRQPVGIECRAYRHGAFSKFASAHLAALIDEADGDPQLGDLRVDLVRITALLLARQRKPLTAATEDALVRLTESRIRVLNAFLKREADDAAGRLGQALGSVVRRYVGDDEARGFLREVRLVLEGGTNR